MARRLTMTKNINADAVRQLAQLLEAEMHPAAVIDLEHGDMNDALHAARDWERELPAQIGHATATPAAREAPSINR